MNVGEIRKLLEGIPDNIRLYTIAGDHEAYEIDFSDWFITSGEHGTWEFFGPSALMEDEEKVRALVTNS